MKRRLRVVKYTRQHKEIKEATDAQVKEAAGKNLDKLTETSPACMRRENDNNENKTRRNEDLKGKGGGRLKHCNVDGDVPLCLRSFDEENKEQQQQQQQREQQRKDGERKQR